jgi:tyrosyl-tRNA synthetase
MENYFTLLTDTPMEKIKELTDSQKTHPKKAKVELAQTIVSQFYGKKEAILAAVIFDKVFAKKQLPDEIQEFNLQLPDGPISVKQLLLFCKLVETGGEAKRMCAQSAVTIDGQKIADSNATVTPKNGMTIQVGKRKFAKIKI